eukprot:TRINITY_DN79987_c0_g1_i1.p1 TRINITY_DN79987_c0_g1~~TRINITY_DN79987_c0_g1_i1.p1  ORF type:complete len:227 (+),score=25.83 TRINITY_DN79987_c0_g1_i1:904-1584(+)
MGIRGDARKRNQPPVAVKYSEADIAQLFMNFYSDQDVYPEVPTANGICDIVIKDLEIITTIEVKKSFTFKVLDQAIRNKNIAHYSFIGVPAFKDMQFKRKLCSDYGIGLITLDRDKHLNGSYNQIVCWEEPVFIPDPKYPPKLEEWMKRSIPGTKLERMTAFKLMIEDLEIALRRAGGRADFEKIINLKRSNYSTVQSAKQTLKNHIRSGVVNSFAFEGSDLVLKI